MKSDIEFDMIFEDLDNKYQESENLQTEICNIMGDLEHLIQDDEFDKRLVIDELDDIIDISKEIKTTMTQLSNIAEKFKKKIKE